jgi:hypothetical protein
MLAQPVVDFGNAALDVGFRPGARPAVFLVQLPERKPVGQAERGAVVDAVLALQWRAGEPDAAEALLGEAAEVFLDVAVSSTRRPRLSSS